LVIELAFEPILIVRAWTALGGPIPPVNNSKAPSGSSGLEISSIVTAGDGDDRNENPLVVLLAATATAVSSATSVDADGIIKLKAEAAVGAAGAGSSASSSGVSVGAVDRCCTNGKPLVAPIAADAAGTASILVVVVVVVVDFVPSAASIDGAVLFRKENDETAGPGSADEA
jgi:hypothetical protein